MKYDISDKALKGLKCVHLRRVKCQAFGRSLTEEPRADHVSFMAGCPALSGSSRGHLWTLIYCTPTCSQSSSCSLTVSVTNISPLSHHRPTECSLYSADFHLPCSLWNTTLDHQYYVIHGETEKGSSPRVNAMTIDISQCFVHW